MKRSSSSSVLLRLSLAALFLAISGLIGAPPEADSDGDGMPDWWEIQYGLDPNDGVLISDGRDGELIVSVETPMTLAPIWAAVTGSNTEGSDRVAVSQTTGFALGDVVLILVQQDPHSDLEQNTTGMFELNRIRVVESASLVLEGRLQHTYSSEQGEKIRVYRVLQYGSVTVSGTLSANGWDGTHGGVLCFLSSGAVEVTSMGVITADGAGYRGGRNERAGERTTGASERGETDSGPRLEGGGGAGLFDANNAGGGGGFGSEGSIGDSRVSPEGRGQGAPPFGRPSLERLFLGGGGGGAQHGGYGGDGGGIILIRAPSLLGNGIVRANGLPEVDRSDGAMGAGGGGGGGGSVCVAGNIAPTLTMESLGGAGGNSGFSPYHGGVGGVGRIRFDIPPGTEHPMSDPLPGYIGDVTTPDTLFLRPYDDTDDDGLDDYGEFAQQTDPTKPDTDSDGLPDGWEVHFGLSPLDPDDAGSHPPGDELTYLEKFEHGLDPTLVDNDQDSLADYHEIHTYWTDPLDADSDSDQMPDGWEVAFRLNPLVRDGGLDPDTDGLSNIEEYLWGLAHDVQLDPQRADSLGDGTGDYERVHGRNGRRRTTTAMTGW